MDKVIGYYGMNNFGGIEVLDIEHGIDDTIVYRYNFGEPEEVEESVVQCDEDGRSFFTTSGGLEVYLDEIVRRDLYGM